MFTYILCIMKNQLVEAVLFCEHLEILESHHTLFSESLYSSNFYFFFLRDSPLQEGICKWNWTNFSLTDIHKERRCSTYLKFQIYIKVHVLTLFQFCVLLYNNGWTAWEPLYWLHRQHIEQRVTGLISKCY